VLLEDNSLKVYNIIKDFDNLENVDKVRLAIYILENKNFSTNYNVDSVIKVLKKVLVMLEPNYINTITNLSKYESLIFLLAKNMELDYNDKKRISVELLFNIFQLDFENENINK